MRDKQFCQVFCCVSVLMAVCLPVWSAPSGLNVIPTADVLDEGVMSLETESDGTGNPWGDGCSDFALLEFGVGHGIELGVDKCTSDDGSWLNFKWCVCDETRLLPAIALGTQAISDGGHPQPFAVATKSQGRMRIHAGVIDMDNNTRLMLGLDHPIGNRLTFQTDYISGSENMATYGMTVNLSNSMSLTLARSLGNSVDAGNGYIVNIAWSKAMK